MRKQSDKNQSVNTDTKPRIVNIAASDYQPSKAELEEDMRVSMSFEKAVEILAQPVRPKNTKQSEP
ncbi:MAG: hypothetical protein F4222_13410 [Gammaproteobacteria bacterium]|nr:hypothetical protein [Gammaproteobacteria bacterium]MYF60042.1 hypothetical protein [Gammaproteobacteria bacterium]